MDIKLVFINESLLKGYNCRLVNNQWINYNITVIKPKYNLKKFSNTYVKIITSCNGEVLKDLTFNLYDFTKYCKNNAINILK